MEATRFPDLRGKRIDVIELITNREGAVLMCILRFADASAVWVNGSTNSAGMDVLDWMYLPLARSGERDFVAVRAAHVHGDSLHSGRAGNLVTRANDHIVAPPADRTGGLVSAVRTTAAEHRGDALHYIREGEFHDEFFAADFAGKTILRAQPGTPPRGAGVQDVELEFTDGAICMIGVSSKGVLHCVRSTIPGGPAFGKSIGGRLLMV